MEDRRDSEEVAPLSDEELDRFIEAEAELEAAPWLVWDDGDIGTAYSVTRTQTDRKGKSEEVDLESLWLLNGYTELSEKVVLLRNGLPGLLARLRAAEDRVAELTEELKTAGTPF